ncbi:hypothetical protein LUZ63_015186 [Rhynchospora breviuscula]|uniref:Citrate synthase n=1 Tax=Rhynchospora breviuscula TaxID=2022672 RepID=A0A9Q0HLT6_9POAL|nr:hypothetical protein LUZ63_015186 [Rhynchospora breviuscula]
MPCTRPHYLLVDGRTGKKYELKVADEGTIKATDFKKITTGPNDKGLKLYDPGYLNTAPVRSAISYIDGDEGILRYRGYPIEEVAENSSFVEVTYLLMYGNLPSRSQLADWEFAISQHSAVPQGVLDIIQAMPHDAHPMGVLVSAMSALSVFHPDANPALRGQDLYKAKQVRDKQIVRVLGKVPTIAAAAYLRLAGRPPVLPSSDLSYSENFLYMLDSLGNKSYKPNPRLARVLDILFILHAEHEMDCSTSAARHLASSGVDVFTALACAVGALYGPLHGGANEAVLKMLSEIGTVENIPDFVEGVKNMKRKMSGFGHRVYKNYDPRAKVICKLAEEVFSIVGRDPLIESLLNFLLDPRLFLVGPKARSDLAKVSDRFGSANLMLRPDVIELGDLAAQFSGHNPYRNATIDVLSAHFAHHLLFYRDDQVLMSNFVTAALNMDQIQVVVSNVYISWWIGVTLLSQMVDLNPPAVPAANQQQM